MQHMFNLTQMELKRINFLNFDSLAKALSDKETAMVKGTIKKEYLGEVLTTRADRFNEEELASIMDAAPIDAEGNLDYKGKII